MYDEQGKAVEMIGGLLTDGYDIIFMAMVATVAVQGGGNCVINVIAAA